ncbi:MAG: helix-turn-helix domain-containing protein [Planctomycetaceae bacterium]|nr:helix-turn-helix domain-containing protein [Planctomycetaceae bacterium]
MAPNISFARPCNYGRETSREWSEILERISKKDGKNPQRKESLDWQLPLLRIGDLFPNKSIGIQQICQTLHISKTTLYRYLKTPDPSDLPETSG